MGTPFAWGEKHVTVSDTTGTTRCAVQIHRARGWPGWPAIDRVLLAVLVIITVRRVRGRPPGMSAPAAVQESSPASYVVFGAMLVVLAPLSGCGLLPSDPDAPPVGLRMDDDQLTALIPECVDQEITSAKVEVTAGASDDVVWSGSDYAGPTDTGVRLTDDSWAEATGTYSDLTAFAVTVVTTDRRYGTVVGRGVTLDDLVDLPPGQFYVNTRSMSVADYADLVSDLPCPTATGPG